MGFEFGVADTAAEKEAVYRFRYSVYVEEMGRYQDTADHVNRRLVEPEDDHSLIFFAREGTTMVATSRLTWGRDGLSSRQIEQYSLRPFLDELPADAIAVGERAMVAPQYRGTGVLDDLLEYARQLLDHLNIGLAFGACEPHLLPLYLGLGQKTYADRNINSQEAGYLIPLISFPNGPEALVGVGNSAERGPEQLPNCIERVLSSEGGAVTSAMLMEPAEYWSEINHALYNLERRGISVFDGFTEDEVERCLARSNMIECDAGDRLLKKGGVARNIFVVLDGTLEARDQGRVVGVLSRGEVFGEIAFLLERPRGLDVFAATDGVRVLSLSEGILRKMIADDAVVAAKLLFNISKMLCLRLVKAS